MLVEDQSRTIAFLRDPATHGGVAVEDRPIETHISVVVLAGSRAFKLKRAVRLPYVDFSTARQRLALCRREVELNRATAPALYRGVRRITREADGRLAFDGAGTLVDAVVEMVRFDSHTLFDAMAGRGELTPALMTALAGIVARFHGEAPVVRGRSGAERLAAVLALNETALASADLFPSARVAALNARCREELARNAALLDDRERDGRVRRCHGDLHLRNICLVDGRPTLFDCIEFDEELATIDVLYDLAFLLMDLWYRDAEPAANLVFNRYLDVRDEKDGVPLLPLFMAVRAAVRAHVTATQAEAAESEGRVTLRRAALDYFDLAQRLLEPVPARLVAVGGFSGSGKSTAAAALAGRLGPAPGARVLSSDRIRKRLCGVAAEMPLPPEAYRSEMSARVYATLAEEAASMLRGGRAAIVDAVFDRPADRARIERIAAEAGVPFAGFWLEAPVETLVARVEARHDDPSDATGQVVREQLARDAGAIGWTRIASSGGRDAVAATMAEKLALPASWRAGSGR